MTFYPYFYTFVHIKKRQTHLLENQPKAYGGSLLTKRKARLAGRPIDTKHTMHLVLRSSKAVGEKSFSRPQNKEKVRKIVEKFSQKNGIKIHSMANVGNHLHFQIKIHNRFTYKPFIRAMTSAIAIAIAIAINGVTRWSSTKDKGNVHRFWDQRPYTRVVIGRRAFLNLRDYIQINVLEGFGLKRNQAKFYLKWNGWSETG